MASCLGIYVNDNIIKYAKVNKEKDNIKIETFGIKFYTDLKQTINQIISETFSFKIPISINITKEAYNYFSMSNLLNKKDLKKAIDTEFDSLCYEKKLNKNAFEARYAISNEANEKDKLKVKALNQCARELLLAQSSDWLFIITNGTMVDYAKKRIKDHIGRFTKLYFQLKNDHVDERFLKDIEEKDCIFPEIDYKIYF